MAFKVLAEVHASLDGLKSDANLIGYEDGSDTIIVSLAPASDQGNFRVVSFRNDNSTLTVP